ncbi:GAF domain-containing SpoIIE family protein phosphatase [Treponema pedis]|uniref:Sigma factor regulatory protein n=2 Tax=Treponema pedis TaxID=409322 RepID=S6A8K5_9SPIR|nr:SpoIIE family protein phosphatase [Treponema pedis]AGT43989.1 sigma factor regulatory protein [Treponema pedis str. T A4]
MKTIDSLNNYTFIAVLCFASFIVIWLIITAKKNKTASYAAFIKAALFPLLFIVLFRLLSAILKISLISDSGLLLAGISFIFFFRYACKLYFKEQAEACEKERQNEAYITKLKNSPAEESKQAQKLLQTSRILLNRTSGMITGKKDISSEMYENIVKVFLEELGADGAVILIADSLEETLAVKAIKGRFPPPYKLPADVVHKEDHVATNFKYAEFKLDESVFGEVLMQGNMRLIKTGEGKNILPDNGEEPFLQYGSLMFFPLIANNRAVGVVAVSRSPGSKSFEESDSKIGENLAAYTAEIVNLTITLNEANESAEIENITETAAEIQSILLPKNLRKIQQLDIGEHFVQVKGICSDYYDVITKGNKTFIITADVAGKSVHSAIIMVMLRSILYLVTSAKNSTEFILDTLNKGITGKIEIDHFASVSILCYEEGNDTLEFIGAGNQALMLWKKSANKIELFKQNTDPIGVDMNSSYKSKTISFERGDIAALYTDGMVETVNSLGEQYGIRRLASVIAANTSEKSKDIAANVKKDMESFMGKTKAHDDQTLLIIKTR